MRFETPKLNISMFEVENIITSDPSGVTPAETPLSANKKAEKIAESVQNTTAILAFN